MKSRNGFTIIEVSLFLAITGLLLLAVSIGVQSSVFQQRYNDSVQNFVEFLRSAYSETTNVQSLGDGRSNRAIYGKLITFGETVDFNGNDVNKPGKPNMIFSYDVIGNVGGDVGSGNVLEALKNLNANVIIPNGSDSAKLAGVAESYTPKWSARIQQTDNLNDFKGAVLIIRHPKSGTVYTYVMNGTTIDVNSQLKQNAGMMSEILEPFLDNKSFTINSIDFCVNPNDGATTRTGRADVRIAAGARSSSAIEVIYDTGDNKCTK